MKKILLILLLNLGMLPLYSQDKESCKDLISEYVKGFSKYLRPDPAKVYYMEMKTDTYFKPEAEEKNTNITVKTWVSGSKIEFESEVMNFYMDDADAFIVLHPQKTIVRNQGGIKSSMEKYNSMLRSNDSILKHSSVLSCKEVLLDGRKVKEVMLVPDAKLQSAAFLSQIVYYYDLKEKRIYKCISRYNERSPKKEEIVTYTKIDYNHKVFPFVKAADKILTTKNEVLSKFKGYEFIDNKNIKK